MTAEESAKEIVDTILEHGVNKYFTFHVRIALMVESLNVLIDIFVEEENYEKAALYRDIITELRRYENGGDKDSYFFEVLHS